MAATQKATMSTAQAQLPFSCSDDEPIEILHHDRSSPDTVPFANQDLLFVHSGTFSPSGPSRNTSIGSRHSPVLQSCPPTTLNQIVLANHARLSGAFHVCISLTFVVSGLAISYSPSVIICRRPKACVGWRVFVKPSLKRGKLGWISRRNNIPPKDSTFTHFGEICPSFVFGTFTGSQGLGSGVPFRSST